MKTHQTASKIVSLAVLLTFSFTNSISYSNVSNLVPRGLAEETPSLVRPGAAKPVIGSELEALGLKPSVAEIGQVKTAVAVSRSELRRIRQGFDQKEVFYTNTYASYRIGDFVEKDSEGRIPTKIVQTVKTRLNKAVKEGK